MVDEIRALCKANGTSLKALERTLGFGNGTIRRWDDSAPAYDKIIKVAEYFNCPVEEITGVDESAIREYNEAVLENIGQLCAHRGIYIADVERELGYSVGTINGWVNAKRRAPLDKLEAVAKHLRVPTQALTGDLPEDAKKEQPVLSEKRQAALELIESLSDEQIDAILRLLGK